MVNLHTAKRFEDLLGEGVEPSPYDYRLLFEAKGWFARGRAKARWRRLKKLDPKLRRVLRPDERVYYVSNGTLSNFGEQFFEGHAAAQYVNRRALVFTTERVILMQLGTSEKPGLLTSELPYAALREVKSTWTGFCQLTLMNGKKHKLSGMPKADRKYLHEFLNGVVAGTGAEATGAGGLHKGSDGLTHLCPHCFTPAPGRPERCPSCDGGIQSANKAALLSLIFPGLGDWYLGYRWLAAMEMFGAGFLWFVMVIAPLLGVRTDKGHEGEAVSDSAFGGVYWAIAAIAIVAAHGIDAVMTRSYGLKGHYPGRAPVAARVV